MALIETDAIVLHAFDYLESSRIVKMLTRDGGVRSVLARGARRSTRRFGPGLDLFVEGVAHLDTKPGRELDSLREFDLRVARVGLSGNLPRFTGASALAELALRFGRDDADQDLFNVLAAGLDALSVTAGEGAAGLTVATAWRMLAALGFAPALDWCTECHKNIGEAETALFSASAGGTLCEACAGFGRRGRKLPAEVRREIASWLDGADPAALGGAELRAHQRLLREFAHEHLTDRTDLPAFDTWERALWGAA